MQKENYETSDLWVSAFILCSGGNLLSTYRQNGRVVYVFQGREGNEKLEQEYLTGKAKVVAKEFVDAFRGIKSLIYRVQ